jgi:transcriptional regulator with XRE-family HTH domain
MLTLKELRIKRKLTLKQVIEKSGIGISYSALSKYENGMAKLPPDVANKLKEFFQEDFVEIPAISYLDYKKTKEQLQMAKQMIKVLQNRVNYYEGFLGSLAEDITDLLGEIRPINRGDKQ